MKSDKILSREKTKFICDNMGYIYEIYENLSINELNGGYFNNVDVKYYLGLFVGKYLNRREIDDEKQNKKYKNGGIVVGEQFKRNTK